MASDHRDHVIHFRVTDDELSAIDAERSRLGMTRSRYLRFLVSLGPALVSLRNRDTRAGVNVIRIADLQDVKNELRRQGVNINQAVKSFNAIADAAERRDASWLRLTLNDVQQQLFDIAASYDRFDESFDGFVASSRVLGKDGRVRP